MAAASTIAKIPLPLNLSDHLHQGENWNRFFVNGSFTRQQLAFARIPQSLLSVVGPEECTKLHDGNIRRKP